MGWVGRRARSQHRTGQIPVSSAVVLMHGLTMAHALVHTQTQQASDSEGTSLLLALGLVAA